MSIWAKFDRFRDRIDAVPGVELALGFAFDRITSPTRGWANGQELILAGSAGFSRVRGPAICRSCSRPSSSLSST